MFFKMGDVSGRQTSLILGKGVLWKTNSNPERTTSMHIQYLILTTMLYYDVLKKQPYRCGFASPAVCASTNQVTKPWLSNLKNRAQVLISSHLQQGSWTIKFNRSQRATSCQRLTPTKCSHGSNTGCHMFWSAIQLWGWSLVYRAAYAPLFPFLLVTCHIPMADKNNTIFSQELQSGDLPCGLRLDESPGNPKNIRVKDVKDLDFHGIHGFWSSSW